MDPRKNKAKEEIKLRPCPVCDIPQFVGSCSSHDICSTCSWHDDYHPIFDSPYDISGANRISISEGRKNFERYGISKPWLLNR